MLLYVCVCLVWYVVGGGGGCGADSSNGGGGGGDTAEDGNNFSYNDNIFGWCKLLFDSILTKHKNTENEILNFAFYEFQKFW